MQNIIHYVFWQICGFYVAFGASGKLGNAISKKNGGFPLMENEILIFSGFIGLGLLSFAVGSFFFFWVLKKYKR